ncbi:MAG: type VI secretion system protein TssA [Azoarcus sp.]|jgi:type VI secretion system protein ImpA|nr:type VI secretion system protein TssA [Azoarcus sp.]
MKNKAETIMDQTTQNKLEILFAPISAEWPGGEDLAYSPLLDEIRAARRADDATLTQGEWDAPLKVAEWGKVCALCEAGLRTRSKDLQLAAWYAEALVRQNGFAGATFGFRLLSGLLQRYWETLHPVFDPDDLDERAGKIEWINTQLRQMLRQVPLTSPQQGGYDWYHWQESRDTENLGLRDVHAREQAIAEGKLAGEVFDKSARDSGVVWFQTLNTDLTEARAGFDELTAEVDRCFGERAPSLGGVREALDACGEVVRRLCEQYGGGAAPESAPVEVAQAGAEAGVTVAARANAAGGGIVDRVDAIRTLREVAYYFHIHEPHSPVAALVERAAKWAEMSLDEWLKGVVKDPATLAQLRELLDLQGN